MKSLQKIVGSHDVENPSAHATVFKFSFNEYFMSNISAPNKGKGLDMLKSEIGVLVVMRAQNLGICILYKWPDYCKTFDFAVLQANGEHYVIQVSLSDLVVHSKKINTEGKEPSKTKFNNEFGLVAKQ